MSAIELKPFHHEAEVALGDEFILRLVIDFGVIDRLEGLIGKPLDEVLGRLNSSTVTMGKFLWAMTRPHHADLSLDQVAGLLFSKDHGPLIAATLGNLVRAAFNIGDPDAEGEQGRPPRKRSAGASRGSSRSGSRQGSARATSGRKRRAAS